MSPRKKAPARRRATAPKTKPAPTTPSDPTISASPLLRLPPELRNEIYALVIASDLPSLHITPRPRRPYAYAHPLSLVNKQLSSEFAHQMPLSYLHSAATTIHLRAKVLSSDFRVLLSVLRSALKRSPQSVARFCNDDPAANSSDAHLATPKVWLNVYIDVTADGLPAEGLGKWLAFCDAQRLRVRYKVTFLEARVRADVLGQVTRLAEGMGEKNVPVALRRFILAFLKWRNNVSGR